MADKLVIYDSVFGNTRRIAQAIGDEIGDAIVLKYNDDCSRSTFDSKSCLKHQRHNAVKSSSR